MEQVATRRNVLVMATVLGLIAAILVYVYMKRAVPPLPNAPVVLARQEIPARTIIEPGMVEMRYREGKQVPEGAIASDQDVVGKVAITPLQQGNVIRRIEVQERSVALGLAYTVPEGMRAVTVALDPIIGVAGFLKPGDHVDVLATFNINAGSVTKTVLQDLELLATGSQVNSQSVDTSGKRAKAQTAPNATLAVDPRDAERLILAESKGKLRLTLRGVGDVVRTPTSGITSRSLIGYVPPDVPEKTTCSAVARPAYQSNRPVVVPPFYGASMSGTLPQIQTRIVAPGPEVEVIKGTQVERVPVKT